MTKTPVMNTLKAHTDLSINDGDTVTSIEKKLPCLLDQNTEVNDLQGYRCWSVGWGKTTKDNTGNNSNKVSHAK